MKSYRKKPVEIEAVQWDGTAPAASSIVDWMLAGGGTARFVDYDPDSEANPYLDVETLEGTMRASVGDWVIRGVKGEFYPCKPDIFAATYDAVRRDETRARTLAASQGAA